MGIYNKSWFIILMLFIAFPFGVYLMYKNKTLNKIHVGLIISINIVVFACIVLRNRLEQMSLMAENAVCDTADCDICNTNNDNIDVNNSNGDDSSVNDNIIDAPKVSADVLGGKNQNKEDNKPKNTQEKKSDSKYNEHINTNSQQNYSEEKQVENSNNESKVVNKSNNNEARNAKSNDETNIQEPPKKEDNKNENSKESVVYVTDKGKKYHVKKCGKGNYHTISLEEAKSKGFEPCKKCIK